MLLLEIPGGIRRGSKDNLLGRECWKICKAL